MRIRIAIRTPLQSLHIALPDLITVKYWLEYGVQQTPLFRHLTQRDVAYS